MQHLHAIKKLPRLRNTDFLKLAVNAAAGFKEPFMLIIQVQSPVYKFIYPESEPVLLAGDTSERQSLTRTITTTLSFIFS